MIEHNTGAKKILIVEDDPTVAALCRRVLLGEGYEVDVANNRNIAQEMIEDKQYEFYLIDIKTPAVNGEELYRWLSERYPTLTKSVVFTSGDTLSGDAEELAEQTGRPFLPKPFSPEELKAAVREVVKKEKKNAGSPI
jgi:DNA-binding response OmpR family regulator